MDFSNFPGIPGLTKKDVYAIADAFSDPLLADDPEFKAVLARIRAEGPTPALLDLAYDVRRRKLGAAAEKAAADAQNALSKMTTSEKLSLGLKQSKPGRTTIATA